MRRRVERTLPPDQAPREIKLGPGGLRDIEFAVQLLQLVHGRTDETLRSPSTLPALAALAQGGYVAREDAHDLAQAYRFLRQVEHLLQLYRLSRTHTLPEDQAVLRATELWAHLAFQLRPDLRILSNELAQTLFWKWLEPMKLPWASSPQAVPVVLKHMQMWMSIFAQSDCPSFAS